MTGILTLSVFQKSIRFSFSTQIKCIYYAKIVSTVGQTSIRIVHQFQVWVLLAM